jgi:hypothetical protein
MPTNGGTAVRIHHCRESEQAKHQDLPSGICRAVHGLEDYWQEDQQKCSECSFDHAAALKAGAPRIQSRLDLLLEV